MRLHGHEALTAGLCADFGRPRRIPSDGLALADHSVIPITGPCACLAGFAESLPLFHAAGKGNKGLYPCLIRTSAEKKPSRELKLPPVIWSQDGAKKPGSGTCRRHANEACSVLAGGPIRKFIRYSRRQTLAFAYNSEKIYMRALLLGKTSDATGLELLNEPGCTAG